MLLLCKTTSLLLTIRLELELLKTFQIKHILSANIQQTSHPGYTLETLADTLGQKQSFKPFSVSGLSMFSLDVNSGQVDLYGTSSE